MIVRYCVAYIVSIMLVGVGVAQAVPQLKSEEAIERNIRHISERLRCPVCQSENLYDSKAPLANEMRQIIREKLSQGRTEEEIISFFVDRYGTFVLQAPPKEGPQLLLWFGPLILMALASFALAWHLRRVDDELGENDEEDSELERMKERQST